MAHELRLVINGRQALFSVTPRRAGDTVLLPFRLAVESCGGTVDYLPGPPPGAAARRGGVRLEVQVGSLQARIGTRPWPLPVPPVMAREVLLVPAEALRPLGIRTALDEPAGALLVGCRDPRLAGRRLLLDPGHGGRDPGAVGPRGSREASVTLEVAQRCASLLALAGAAPSLTRTTDRTVSLPVRVALAESRRAELFLSVHANSFTDPRVHGTETYYYETWESRRLAEAVQRELVAELDLADRGVKEASFYVLRQTRLPACLAELAFLSNPREEELLAVPWFRLKAATALFRGVRSFVEGRTA